ncbi:MAG: Pvc16 family protein [bacterium]
MFNDVDETLKQHLIADLPISQGEVDVSFERPTREWSGRLARPTLNCFLYDIRERTAFRDDTMVKQANGRGGFTRRIPARRIDLSYMITAWTREPEDEHRILARVLASMFRTAEFPSHLLQGALNDSQYPLLARIAPGDHLTKPADMWGVLDNELRTGLVWILTAPLEAFAPVEGPLVRTRELRVGNTTEDWRENFVQIAGTAHLKGAPEKPVSGVQVSVAGTALRAVTGDDGRYAFPGVPPGDHVIRYETGDGKQGERPVTVPGETYDIEL